MSALNENQKNNLLITFRHIDKLLLEFECILDVMIPRSPLQQYVNDVSQDLHLIIGTKCDHLRKVMCRILKEKGVSIGKPGMSVLNQINVSLVFADIATEELRPKYMKGYGALSDVAADELNEIVQELKQILKEIKEDLPK